MNTAAGVARKMSPAAMGRFPDEPVKVVRAVRNTQGAVTGWAPLSSAANEDALAFWDDQPSDLEVSESVERYTQYGVLTLQFSIAVEQGDIVVLRNRNYEVIGVQDADDDRLMKRLTLGFSSGSKSARHA